MSRFQFRDGQLCADAVPLLRVAREFGTPCFVYSRAAIESAWRSYDSAFADRAHLVCYAVKANGNLGVLDVLARLGSGFDIVSVGELERVLAAGGAASRVVFSGVGKRREEMQRAMSAGICCFNVESSSELELLARTAGDMGCRAPVALRVNPDVDAGTHPYIATGLRENKFGIPFDEAIPLYRRAATLPSLEVTGIACHIGSQVLSVKPYLDALDRMQALWIELAQCGIALTRLDLGGGLGIAYRDEIPPQPLELVEAVCKRVTDPGITLQLEPGRSIVGPAGVLLTRVEYLKHNRHRRFAVVDAAMNDLLRPALYGAWMEIRNVREQSPAEPLEYDVVGPVCESADLLGRARRLALEEGDLLAVMQAGAYGAAMASNYNARPRAAEVMVDGEAVHCVRDREPLEQLWAGESRLPS